MNLLHSYQNGNVSCSIYDDGTAIREFDGIAEPIWPCSIDVKVTDYCDAGCTFCHEMSTVAGKHGDLALGLDVLTQLPAGCEIAIGGGNPLSHPGLYEPFLETLKAKGLIANLTVNQLHLKKFQSSLDYLLNERMIYGLGISYHRADSNWLDRYMTPNTVIHMIIGVHSIKELTKIQARWPNAKVLLLGYKQFGRGNEYFEKANHYVKSTMYGWYTQLHTFFNSGLTLSFDNLAIEQLKMRRFFTDTTWKNFYMGDDGTFTMYMDLVQKTFAPTSTSKERWSITNSMRDMFARVRDEHAH